MNGKGPNYARLTVVVARLVDQQPVLCELGALVDSLGIPEHHCFFHAGPAVPAGVQEILSPQFLAMKAGVDVASCEKLHLAALRLVMAGTRTVVCASGSDVRKYMVEVYGAKEPNNSAMWNFSTA